MNDEPTVAPPPNKLQGDPADWEANYNMRKWVLEALEARGAICIGSGFGACLFDLDIELEGMRYNIQIRPHASKWLNVPDTN